VVEWFSVNPEVSAFRWPAASVLFIVELEKALVRRWHRRLWPGE
jgi:hypothetical protein